MGCMYLTFTLGITAKHQVINGDVAGSQQPANFIVWKRSYLCLKFQRNTNTWGLILKVHAESKRAGWV